MTDITLALRGARRFAHRFRTKLALRLHRRAPAADNLSDHMLGDIGVKRDPLDQMATRTLHDAMRYSG